MMARMRRLWILIQQEDELSSLCIQIDQDHLLIDSFPLNAIRMIVGEPRVSTVHRKRNVSNSTVSRRTWSLMLEEMNAIEACMRSQQSKLTKSFDVANRPMLQVTGSSSLRANLTRDSEKSRNRLTSDMMCSQQLNSKASS